MAVLHRLRTLENCVTCAAFPTLKVFAAFLRRSRPIDSNSTPGRHAGFSLVELLVVIVVIGILATLVVPQLLMGYERARQRRSMAEMRAIAAANGAYRVDSGGYAAALADMVPEYMSTVPPGDAWGTGWAYAGARETYTLTSYGRDGASGPAPPSPWHDEPFEADLVLANGAFTQAPETR